MPDPRPPSVWYQCLVLGLAVYLGLGPGVGMTPAQATVQSTHPALDTESPALWFDTSGPTQASRELFRVLARTPEHGLPPARYELVHLRNLWGQWHRLKQTSRLAHNANSISNRIEEFSQTTKHSLNLAELEVELDATFERAFNRLLNDLGRGMLDAERLQTGLFRPQPSVDTEGVRTRLRDGQWSVHQALLNIAPAHEHYQRLVERMRTLLAERAAGHRRQSIRIKRPWHVADRGPEIEQLKRRLIQTGELSVATPVTPIFDAHTLVALQAFQRRHGLEASGVLDQYTVEALNTSVHQQIEQVAMSLERWRWMPRELGHRHVLVNLPDYRVVMMNGTQKILDMPAVVGKPEHSTPVFSRKMSYMEINPTWTVPASITNRELIPMERHNPGYLDSQGFEYLQRLDNRYELVEPGDVPAEAFDQDPFPYVLRQRPGPKNALGRMKFMMPNEYAIYLHDTLSTHLFDRTDRAYSHGCVRVSQPDRLATTLLLIDGRSPREVEQALSADNTFRVNLRAPVPTHMAYYTHWVDASGQWQARPDIYGHNTALLRALRDVSQVAGRAPHTPPSTHPAAG